MKFRFISAEGYLIVKQSDVLFEEKNALDEILLDIAETPKLSIIKDYYLIKGIEANDY